MKFCIKINETSESSHMGKLLKELKRLIPALTIKGERGTLGKIYVVQWDDFEDCPCVELTDAPSGAEPEIFDGSNPISNARDIDDFIRDDIQSFRPSLAHLVK